MRWRSDPQFKLEISGETFTCDEAFTVTVKRIENNLSYGILEVNDYKSKNYVDVFDTFDSLTVSLRYGSDSWSKVFTGDVTTAKPHLDKRGELLDVGAWGEGKALNATLCDESYGVESIDNSTVDTPKEILDDLIANHINKEFGGAASGHAIVSAVDNAHAGFSVTHLNSQYLNNFVNVNTVCSLTNAYAQGPDKKLMFKKIDADHTGGNWDRYYGGSQANATIEVAKDLILYDFSKNVEEYANSIVLSSKLRKPSEDYWTEDNGGAALWGTDGEANVSDVNGAGPPQEYIVGSHSLKIDMVGAVALGEAWYPAAKNAGWNLDNMGSVNTIPQLCMYGMRNDANDNVLSLFTDATHYSTLYTDMSDYIPGTDEWAYLSFPVGSYHHINDEYSKKRWYPPLAGQPVDWTDVNWIQFSMVLDVTTELYIDDLHFSGVVVREARDTSEITANDLHQKLIRNDTAVNDTLVASDDSGTAAQLAYAELLRRSQTPIVAMIQIPLLPDLLPGQTLHIHACKKTDGTFRVDADYRVKDLRHVINNQGATTIVNLTSDVTNSHAFGVADRYALMRKHAGALNQGEARNLKGGDIDNQIPRLSVNY